MQSNADPAARRLAVSGTSQSQPHTSVTPESPHSETEAPSAMRRLDVSSLPGHRDKLFRAAFALCRSRDDAEDLVQETFERVLRRPRLLRGNADLAYLMKVLRNTWINTHYYNACRPKTAELDESVEFVIDYDADPGVSVTELRAVYSVVSDLTPPLRETIVAVDIVGLSYRQAAAALGVRQGTIMSRLSRARSDAARRLELAGIAPYSRRT